MTPRVMGLDMSLTSTGLAVANDEGGADTATLDPAPRRGMDRIMWLREAIGTCCLSDRDEPLVVIEDYAFSRGASHAHELGELGGVVKAMLIGHHVPYVLVPPTVLKLYALGKGGGKGTDKTAMALAAYKRAGVEFPDDNQCDAWWLRQMGLDALGQSALDLPAGHRKALSSVVWPTVFGDIGAPA